MTRFRNTSRIFIRFFRSNEFTWINGARISGSQLPTSPEDEAFGGSFGIYKDFRWNCLCFHGIRRVWKPASCRPWLAACIWWRNHGDRLILAVLMVWWYRIWPKHWTFRPKLSSQEVSILDFALLTAHSLVSFGESLANSSITSSSSFPR